MKAELVVEIMTKMAESIYRVLQNGDGPSFFGTGIPYATDFYYHDFRHLRERDETPFLWTFGTGFAHEENMSGTYFANAQALRNCETLREYGWMDVRRLWVWDGRDFLDISDDMDNWRNYLYAYEVEEE